MGWKEFAASVIGDLLSWPVLAFIVVLLLLQPIKRLIGRIKNAKGLGAELEFDMETLESSTDEAIVETAEAQKQADDADEKKPARPVVPAPTADSQREPADGDRHVIEPGPHAPYDQDEWDSPDRFALFGNTKIEDGFRTRLALALQANKDPSGAIIGAWENVLASLYALNEATRGPGRPTRNPRKVIEQLRRSGGVSESFIASVEGLLKVRNEVAHGEASPTPGVARTYMERALQIEVLAKNALKKKISGDEAEELEEPFAG